MSKDVEIWKETQYPKYLISNYGRVKSLQFKKPRILATPVHCHGYRVVHLVDSENGKRNGIYVKIHRLVAKAFLKNPDVYPEVNHIDGNKLNNHPSNLIWCNRSQNIRHAIQTGLMTFNRCAANAASDKRIFHLYHPDDDKTFVGLRCQFCKVHNISSGEVGNVVRGIRSHIKGWEIIKITA